MEKKIMQVILVIGLVVWAFSFGMDIGETNGYSNRRYYEKDFLRNLEIGEVYRTRTYDPNGTFDIMTFEITRVK